MLKKNKIVFLVALALLVFCVVGDLKAGTWTSYAVGDVMLGFRKTGVPNLVVDIGPVTNLTTAVKNKRIAISQYTGNQLAQVGTNGAIWSAFTYFDGTVSPASAQYTLFMTRARNTINRQSTPWISEVQLAQQTVGGTYMGELPVGAQACATYNVLNTSTAVIEPDNSDDPNYNVYPGHSYSGVLGPNLNFNDSWEGTPEKTTPATFTTAGAVIRSDFYQIDPNDTSDGVVTFLGYFEFNTNGAMTYVAYPTAPTVTTVVASAVTGTGAQLNAAVTTINTNTDNTSYYFQYGLNTSYGNTTTVSNIGTNSGNYGLAVSSLTAGTLYHFQAVAYNQYGTNYGGDLTFTTTGGVPTAPVITGFHRTNSVSYVSFTTGSSGTYTLRGTNNAGLTTAARTNWPAIASTPGNGAVNTLQDTTTNNNKLYIITAQ